MSQGTREAYRAPVLVRYGSIDEHTFATPGGHAKNGQTHTNLDALDELAGNPHGAAS